MLIRLTLGVEVTLDVTEALAKVLEQEVLNARAGEPAIVGAVHAAGKLAEDVPLDFLVLAVCGEQYADLITRAIQQYSPPPTDATLLKTLVSYGETPEKMLPSPEVVPQVISKNLIN